jgi:hypothetical protein
VADDLRFEWDPNKAKGNIAKHGVSFEEAATVFYYEPSKIDDDPDHSIGERRELIFGRSTVGRFLLVSFTGPGRLDPHLHARQATKSERRKYEEDLIP